MQVLGNDELIKVVAGSEKYDEGQTLQLQCIITRKVSVVSWFKDNKQLNADSGGRITVLSTKLSVKGLMANDSGLYTCLAKDSSGQNLNGSLFITIKSKSVITSIRLTLCLIKSKVHLIDLLH